jgi:hypothetical protein
MKHSTVLETTVIWYNPPNTPIPDPIIDVSNDTLNDKINE